MKSKEDQILGYASPKLGDSRRSENPMAMAALRWGLWGNAGFGLALVGCGLGSYYVMHNPMRADDDGIAVLGIGLLAAILAQFFLLFTAIPLGCSALLKRNRVKRLGVDIGGGIPAVFGIVLGFGPVLIFITAIIVSRWMGL